MREGSPSVTAMFVAFARAVSSHEPSLSSACKDPSAEALSAGAFRFLLRSAARHPRSPAYAIYRRASGGLVDHVAVRTAIIDAAVHEAVEAGIGQLVILGAGFDGRAHRMTELAEVTVFEVDHPSTQKLKQRKAEGLGRTAREIRYAGCDFERVSLESALDSVGFEPAKPSVWIWEGVTMYLHASAVTHSLNTIARLSAPESRLISSYLTPEFTSTAKLLGKLGAKSLGTLSEPIRFTARESEMHALLSERGFSPISDVLPSAVAGDYGAEVFRHAFMLPTERVVVSVRQSSAPGMPVSSP